MLFLEILWYFNLRRKVSFLYQVLKIYCNRAASHSGGFYYTMFCFVLSFWQPFWATVLNIRYCLKTLPFFLFTLEVLLSVQLCSWAVQLANWQHHSFKCLYKHSWRFMGSSVSSVPFWKLKGPEYVCLLWDGITVTKITKNEYKKEGFY